MKVIAIPAAICSVIIGIFVHVARQAERAEQRAVIEKLVTAVQADDDPFAECKQTEPQVPSWRCSKGYAITAKQMSRAAFDAVFETMMATFRTQDTGVQTSHIKMKLANQEQDVTRVEILSSMGRVSERVDVVAIPLKSGEVDVFSCTGDDPAAVGETRCGRILDHLVAKGVPATLLAAGPSVATSSPQAQPGN